MCTRSVYISDSGIFPVNTKLGLGCKSLRIFKIKHKLSDWKNRQGYSQDSDIRMNKEVF